MMKSLFVILALFFGVASAFGPTLFGVQRSSSTICFAKHANDKGAKWAASKRPKKRRLSDIHRKKVEYELPTNQQKPAEYTIDSAAASPAVKKSE